MTPTAAAAATYSIDAAVVAMLMDLYRDVTDEAAIAAVRNESIVPGLADIAPGLGDALADLGTDLWRGVDSVHHGARPLFAAHRGEARPGADQPVMSAWLAANCLRELRGDHHWALCAEEWIARSRGNDDDAIDRGWARLEAKGYATDSAINDDGRRFRHELERRTDELTLPAWQAVGEAATRLFCETIEPHHDAFVARIDATAGPRWMPALRTTDR